jgi:hypothetical protein
MAMSAARSDLSAMMADLFEMAHYYVGLGYRVRAVGISQMCARCGGKGEVRKGVRVVKRVRCPDCRGNGILARLPDFNCRPHEGVRA